MNTACSPKRLASSGGRLIGLLLRSSTMARSMRTPMIAGYGLPEFLRITIGTESEVKAVQESLGRFVAANK